MTLVGSGLAGVGVRAVPLGTEEVIELLYRSFNPGELENPIRLDTPNYVPSRFSPSQKEEAPSVMPVLPKISINRALSTLSTPSLRPRSK